jgi:DNA-binding MarR family transcriptional regulator
MAERDDRHSTVLDKLLELTVVLNADMKQFFAREGLTLSRTHLLWHVYKHGPLTQRALAEALAVSARNITGLVDAMVETGFVTRELHPADRRATLVTLTDRGAAAARALEHGQGELARHLFGDLSEEELEQFSRGLDHVLSRLQAAILAPDAPAADISGRTT